MLVCQQKEKKNATIRVVIIFANVITTSLNINTLTVVKAR